MDLGCPTNRLERLNSRPEYKGHEFEFSAVEIELSPFVQPYRLVESTNKEPDTSFSSWMECTRAL